jgi:hypothetical protein
MIYKKLEILAESKGVIVDASFKSTSRLIYF